MMGRGAPWTWVTFVAIVIGTPGTANADPFVDARFSLALRLRPEARIDPDLDTSEDDSLALVGSRMRATFTLDAAQRVRLVAQIQDGRRFGSEASPTADEASLDLHQGFLDAYGFFDGKMELRAGRMELSYGDERLIGPGNWSDIGRAFDGAALRALPRPDLAVEIFGAWVRERRLLRLVDDTGSATERFTSGDGVTGLYAAWRPVASHQLDAYLLARFDGPTATPRLPERDRRIFAPGLRLSGGFGTLLKYGIEGVVQTGISNGTCQPPCTTRPQSEENRHFAWAIAASLQLTLPVAASPFIGVEIDMASGDGDPLDGESREFDNFFPSNHPHYGVMDIIGWRNLRDVRLRAGVTPWTGWSFSADVHLLGLQQRHGAWSDDAGNLMDDDEFDPYYATDRNLGTEVDLTASWAKAPVKVASGLSAFVPGAAARERRGDDPSYWAYLMIEVALDGAIGTPVLHSPR